MTFCTKCGHKNLAEARFCEECGNTLGAQPIASAPQATRVEASPAQQSVETQLPRKFNTRLIKMAGIGVGVLIAAGVGLFLMLAPESPSNERFAKAIDRSLASNSQAYRSHYCLGNFPYDQDQVRINEQDSGTRRWLAVLTKAGLYSEPELVIQDAGYFIVRQLVYVKTEAGKKATQSQRLCIADGVAVAKVDSFSPPEKLGQFEVSRANVTLKLREPLPWVLTEETKAAAPNIQSEFSANLILALKDGKWEVANDQEIQVAALAQRKLNRQQAQSADRDNGPGFFPSLLKLFSGSAGNPIIGRWKSDVMGIAMVSFEFDSDSMISSGQKVKVRYEMEEKRVTVYPEGADVGLIVNIIDPDTLSLNMGMMDVKLTRAN